MPARGLPRITRFRPGQTRALAVLAEIASAAGNSDRVAELIKEIGTLELTSEDRATIAAELQTVTDLQQWLANET